MLPVLAPLPESLRPLLDAYVAALRPLAPRIVGVYAHGSLALGAYEAGRSDVDLVVLTDRALTSAERRELGQLHARLAAAHPLAATLDALYLPLADAGQETAAIAPYPVVRDGRFRAAGRGDLNAVTWWLVRHRGIPLLGPPPADLPLAVEWSDVIAAMRHNLDVYWADKARRRYLFLSDFWVGFAVATLCRILTTLEDGELVGKTAALERWCERLPAHWRPLVDGARHLRAGHCRALPVWTRVRRMQETVAFVGYVRRRAASPHPRPPLPNCPHPPTPTPFRGKGGVSRACCQESRRLDFDHGRTPTPLSLARERGQGVRALRRPRLRAKG